MEGKSVVFDLSFCLFLFYKIPHFEVVEEVGALLTKIVQQIVIEVSCAGQFR